jgi:Peptidase family S41/N-terminal domain of Peptidase_S41 in eukaryotic IRBP
MKIITILLSVFLSNNLFSQILTKNEIKEVTIEIPSLISVNYVDAEKSKEIAKRFQDKINSGTYNKVMYADSLVAIINKDLKEISNDGHLYIRVVSKIYNKETKRNWEEDELEREKNQNYGFKEVQILPKNIGYIKVTEFMHPKRSMQTAIAAMKFIENTTSLIMDLRGNGGGYPGIMEYILNHYFDGEPKLLSITKFSDKTIVPTTNYSSDLIYGKLRIGTPLYILIDDRTASAAEYFA